MAACVSLLDTARLHRNIMWENKKATKGAITSGRFLSYYPNSVWWSRVQGTRPGSTNYGLPFRKPKKVPKDTMPLGTAKTRKTVLGSTNADTLYPYYTAFLTECKPGWRRQPHYNDNRCRTRF
jgi:hypothetical protein